MIIEIRDAPFDPYQELAGYQERQSALKGEFGATATFVGTMRGHHDGENVRSMLLEHYPDMTERHLGRIVDEAGQRWTLQDSLLIHRVGTVYPGESIVLVAVWSAHRADAFEACRFIMEDLKSQAPFWKKEFRASGERWIEKNTPGYTADSS